MSNKLAFGSMNPWRGISYSAVTVTIFLVGAGFVCDAWAKDEVTFHFNPPDGTSFVETLRHTTSRVSQELRKPVAQIKESKVQYVIHKTDFGYSVVMKPLQPRIKALEDASGMLKDVLSNVVLTYDLDTQGKLMRVRGIKVVLEELKKTLPAGEELTDLVLSFLGKTFEQAAADTWNNRGMGVQANLVGKTYVLNKIYSLASVKQPFLKGSSIQGSLTLKISGPIAHNDHRCIKVQYSYESTDPNVGGIMGEVMRSLIISFFEKTKAPDANEVAKLIPNFQISDLRLIYKLEQLVDATTGLIYSEVETSTRQMLFGLEGEEKSRLTLKEIKEYFYAYKNN